MYADFVFKSVPEMWWTDSVIVANKNPKKIGKIDFSKEKKLGFVTRCKDNAFCNNSGLIRNHISSSVYELTFKIAALSSFILGSTILVSSKKCRSLGSF